eukprot:COSAG06_NODE_52979_length_302_cov_1.482759_1_plen_69_part_10
MLVSTKAPSVLDCKCSVEAMPSRCVALCLTEPDLRERTRSAWGARANCGGRRFVPALTHPERSSAQDSV